VSVRVPAGAAAAQFRVLDAAARPLSDARLRGSTSCGGTTLALDPDAAMVEAYDAVSGALLGSGPVTTDNKVVLTPVAGK
jgi:hypothetical protein